MNKKKDVEVAEQKVDKVHNTVVVVLPVGIMAVMALV